MTQSTPEGTPNIFPFLRYKDAPAAIEWLISAFGFEKHSVTPEADGGIAHAELRFGPGMIMLGTAKDDILGMKTARDLGAVNQGIYVHVADVDAHHDRAKNGGAEIVFGLTDMEYGSREYSARDLEGNLWSFGTYLPGAAG